MAKKPHYQALADANEAAGKIVAAVVNAGSQPDRERPFTKPRKWRAIARIIAVDNRPDGRGGNVVTCMVVFPSWDSRVAVAVDNLPPDLRVRGDTAEEFEKRHEFPIRRYVHIVLGAEQGRYRELEPRWCK